MPSDPPGGKPRRPGQPAACLSFSPMPPAGIDLFEVLDEGVQQRRKPGERQLRFEFDPLRREHPHTLGLLGRVAEEGALADPRLAAEEERPASALARRPEEPLDTVALRFPPRQRPPCPWACLNFGSLNRASPVVQRRSSPLRSFGSLGLITWPALALTGTGPIIIGAGALPTLPGTVPAVGRWGRACERRRGRGEHERAACEECGYLALHLHLLPERCFRSITVKTRTSLRSQGLVAAGLGSSHAVLAASRRYGADLGQAGAGER
jgi:hypothetical protein